MSESLAEPSEPTLIEKEADVLHTLERIAAERARTEADTERTFRARKEAEARGFQETLEKVTTTATAEIQTTQGRYQSVKKGLLTQFATERENAQKEADETRRKVTARAASVRKSAKKENEDTRWNVLAVFEAAKDNSVKAHKNREGELAAALELLHTIHDDSVAIIAACGRFAPKEGEEPVAVEPPPATDPAAVTDPAAAVPTAPGEVAAVAAPENAEAGEDGSTAPVPPPPDNPIAALKQNLEKTDELLTPLTKVKLLGFLRPQVFIWPFLFLFGGLAVGLGMFAGLGWTVGPIIAGVVAIGAAIGAWIALSGKARKQIASLYPPFRHAIAQCEKEAEECQTWVKATFEKRKTEIAEKRESDLKRSEEKANRLTNDAEERRNNDLRQLDEKLPVQIADIDKRRDEQLKQVEERYPKRLAELKEKLESDTKQLKEDYRLRKEKTQHEHNVAWTALFERWKQGIEQVAGVANDVNETCSRLFLDWHKTDLESWQSPTAAPPALRFGEFTVDLNEIPQGLSTDERLRAVGPTKHVLPALVPFPTQGSILLKAFDQGKVEASKILQTMMLQYATAVPPGKVRFTIVDPVGLGENFAAFMHLGDYSELLITNRIWTEASHIEQKLTDLQEHMENVIQKYLRNEFETIEAYNIHAGEVAEPFRVLVVANFPANFNESAARRLVSIASSGARCGVYVLLSIDTKLPLPSGCQLKDLEPHCLNLTWRDGRFQWKDPEFSQLPLVYDTAPDATKFSRLMHIVGDRARNANRVEVPFEFIAPKREDYWKQDSARIIDIPLGRAGATKLQSLKLGRGTSQHMLVAGKTGSGKSTLLHALITNGALRYSPDQLQFYLIDFKKGVEFKVYAALQLPHAKVIAVESEREFGLSVLQRLDVELKVRGDRFRDLGVQDIGSYRKLPDQPPLPRILLVIDEFQEFFVEDDKVAQDTSLLLDRLVRQGRAFGVHVHLGSQSLGGSYSLPRSTLGQMAIRIALQCSESDAHVILSEDNSAARLLTRPGEAIYNDQNGMVEGNNFFQVVWLSDERRERYLEELAEMWKATGRPPVDQIVFEGNLPAVAAKNPLLAPLLDRTEWPETPRADYAWLGEAIAIKDPTAAIFRPQSGSNLLIVGQQEGGAIGMFSTILISLGAQYPPGHIRFFLLDGTPADAADAGLLGKHSQYMPHEIRDVTWREIGNAMGEIHAEVERRQTDASDSSPIYLFVYDLQRFRDLRKSDDDFGFSRPEEGKAIAPSRMFTTILRDGPPVNIHTIVWCDSLNNLNRTFDRQGLREFEIRVLYQMSANDSSNLIDSPVAGKLGPARALYFSEEEGKLEKFRPYGSPPDEWLEAVRDRLSPRPIPPPPSRSEEHRNGNGESSSAPAPPVEDLDPSMSLESLMDELRAADAQRQQEAADANGASPDTEGTEPPPSSESAPVPFDTSDL